jgi:hypothetical protein
MRIFPVAILICFYISKRVPKCLYENSQNPWHTIIATILEVCLHYKKYKSEHEYIHHKNCKKWYQIIKYLNKHLNQEAIAFIESNILKNYKRSLNNQNNLDNTIKQLFPIMLFKISHIKLYPNMKRKCNNLWIISDVPSIINVFPKSHVFDFSKFKQAKKYLSYHRRAVA